MTKNQLYWFGTITEVMVRAMGMQAENSYLQAAGKTPAYRQADFEKVLNDHGVYQNSMIDHIIREDV